MARDFLFAGAPTLAAAVALTDRIAAASGSSLQSRRLLARVWCEIGIGALRSSRYRSLSTASLLRATVLDPTQIAARIGSVLRLRSR
ncbi:MAG TPA: hypothetical protein DEP35_10830 [Deltaproteobacteria bacterium]|nr:hypothetical protein [Deltaproteobacteria bacterium]